jgi:choline-sulfatase
LPAEHHVDHWIADCTLRQIERHRLESPDRPFFMYMSSPKPHAPYDPPRPYDALYDPRAIPAPFGSCQDLCDRNPELECQRATHALTSLSPEALQTIRSYYYGSVSFLDAQIGRVLCDLEARSLLDNTLVLFSADHGDLLGDFGTFFKMNHLNGSVRIPLMIAGPGVATGVESHALVGLQDLLPTLAKFAGAEIGQPVHGLDLSSHLTNVARPVRDLFYAHTGNTPEQSVMVCDGTWKYIYSEHGGVEELYNQSSDPGELKNLAGDPEQTRRMAELRRRLRQCAKDVGDTTILSGNGFVSRPLDRESIRRLPVNGMGWRFY